MNKKMHIINSDAIVHALQEIKCGKKEFVYINSEDFEILCSEVEPPAGYTPQENFPNCCDFHKQVLINANERLQMLPFCCEQHKKLHGQRWFNKVKYADIPPYTVKAVNYSEFQITTKIDVEDWYEDITEYLEYCIRSFGQFPTGFGPPVGLQTYKDDLIFSLKDNLKRGTHPKEKLERIIQYLNCYGQPTDAVEPTDLNILISHYKKWLKIFPFDISYFAHLEEYYKNTYPVLIGEVSHNRYMGTVSQKVVTYTQLLQSLSKITIAILTTINSLQLFETGKLDNIDYRIIELANSTRRLELEDLKNEEKEDRAQYIKLIKKWLKGEEKYLKKIAPILRITKDDIFIR
jgi:hypothetical protein